MSNAVIYSPYWRFALYNNSIVAGEPNTDFALHFSFDSNYILNLIKENGGNPINIDIIYSIDHIVNYFQIVYYMITKCNLTFNTKFKYPDKRNIAKAVKKGIFALEAIKKLNKYKKDYNLPYYTETVEIRKEKKNASNRGLVILVQQNQKFSFSKIKDMNILDLIHYSSIKEVVNFLEYSLDTKTNKINFSISEPLKKFIDEFNISDFSNYILNKENYLPKIKNSIIKTPEQIDFIETLPKNILFKGVPGTGKSRTIDNIIKNKLLIEDSDQILKVNIHDSTSNSDLMQGIGISTNEQQVINYKEKSGLILNFIERAILNPQLEHALILEEVQENSLNKIIGDLIYLIEKNKRTTINIEDISQFGNTDPYKLVKNLILKRKNTPKPVFFVSLPNLIENTETKNLVFPSNLFVFCTTNYRDDKKIIEDNLLRRFDVIELYPNSEPIGNDFIKEIFENLNNAILTVMSSQESHPDRFMIGQAIWIEDSNNILKPLLKTFIEFKDIRNIDFNNAKEILKLIVKNTNENNIYKPNLDLLLSKNNYKDLLDYLQKEVYKGIW